MNISDSIQNLIPVTVLFGQIIFVIVLYLFLVERKRNNFLYDFFAHNSLLFAFVVALAAMIGSLFYSNVRGYNPCELCWFQRIAMYPQVLLLGIALWKKDTKVWLYSISLAAIGILISAFHYYGQMFDESALPCAVVGQTSACAQRFVIHYGYITIPMMAFTAFALIILFMSIYRHKNK